ncbi:response regulator transcription factor [Pyxidicoccus sp. 3LG]
MGERILLVEDDPQLGAQIVEHLRGAGFEPMWWREGRLLTPGGLPDVSLVVLDLMLPGTYGMDMLKALRTFSEVPVLILSARNDTLDKVRALKLGADDYMTKPFWPEELIERVRARLRRPTLQKADAVVEVGALRIDLQAHEVFVQGQPVELTRVEFALLAALARRPREAVTRQWLVEHVLDPEREGTERTLDVHVSRLRRKLGAMHGVETVWGVGYRLVPGDGS